MSITAARSLVSPPVPPALAGAPEEPPIQFSTGRDRWMLDGPTAAPTGAVTVNPGDNSVSTATANNPPGTTFWLAPGIHQFGSGGDVFGGVTPKTGNVYIGAPGAIMDGLNTCRYAFKGFVNNITLRYITIQNFGVEQGLRDEGVVNKDSGSDWTIDNCIIRNNAGAGVFFGPRMKLRYSWLTGNRQYGFSMFIPPDPPYTPSSPNMIPDIVFDHCEISHNNQDRWEERIPGCGCSGGGKFWDVNGAQVTNNWCHSNLSTGFWADTNNVGMVWDGNYIQDNTGPGVFYEISYNAKITRNAFVRNHLVGGRLFASRGDNFPLGAIYISESGGDSRVNGGTYANFEIANNLFMDNWGGVIVWENADRFYNSPGNTSGTGYVPKGGIASQANCNNPTATVTATGATTAGSTRITTTEDYFFNVGNTSDDGRAISGAGIPVGAKIADPAGDPRGVIDARTADMDVAATATATGVTFTMAAGTINTEPAKSDCRWKSQNLDIHHNDFRMKKADIGATGITYAGQNSVLSNSGSYPSWTPYSGTYVQEAISKTQNNKWRDNRYIGEWSWNPYQPGQYLGLAAWQGAPWNQDPRSELQSALDAAVSVRSLAVARAALADVRGAAVPVTSALPGVPTIGVPTSGDGFALVPFTPPTPNGARIIDYTATSTPGGITATAESGPIQVNGLANGTAYTFTVRARTAAGSSHESAPSASVTPAGTDSYGVTGASHWYKADALTGLVNGDPVASFTDSSGNGRHATQGVVADQPSYVTAVVNAKPVIRLGAGDHLLVPDTLAAFTAAEVFLVSKITVDPPAGDSTSGLWTFGSAGDSTHFPYTDGTIYDGFGTTVRKTTVNPVPSLAAWNIYQVSSSAGNWTSWLDGTQLFTTATNTVGFTTAPVIGRSNGGFVASFVGDIAELLIFPRALTGAERTSVISGLKTKYAIA